MQNSIFCVNTEPYSIWDPDLKCRNKDFLIGLDPDYFEYTIKLHSNADDEQRASVGLQLVLHHAIETLFSLLGAYIQAPDCAYAWLAKCSTTELRSLVQRISSKDEEIFTKLPVDSLTWESVAQSVFKTYLPNTENQALVAKHFSLLWARLANQLCDQTHIDEYNAMKHGFRVRRGGFSIEMSEKPYTEIHRQDADMVVIGKSDFGSSFFTLEALTPKQKTRSLRINHVCTNWSVQRMVFLSQLVHISISNVITALRVQNGFMQNECKFTIPSEKEDFDRPWELNCGVNSLRFQSGADEKNAVVLTKDDLLKIISEK